MADSKFNLVFFLGLLGLCVAFWLQVFWPFLTPVILASVTTSIFFPIFTFFQDRLKCRPELAALLATSVIIFCGLGPMIYFLGVLVEQALHLYDLVKNSEDLRKTVGWLFEPRFISEQLGIYLKPYGIEVSQQAVIDALSNAAKTVGAYAYENFRLIASNLLAISFHFFVFIVMIYSLFVYGSNLRKYLSGMLPFPEKEQDQIISSFKRMGKAIFIGNGLVSVLEGLLGGFAIYAFGMGPALLWGAVIALAAFLPVVGASVVFIPATLFLAVKGTYLSAGLYLAFNLAYSMLLEWYVKAKVIGGNSELNSIFILLAILGGIQAFGILGLFFGPLSAALLLSLLDIYKTNYRSALFENKS